MRKNRGDIFVSPVWINKKINTPPYKLGHWMLLNNMQDDFFLEGKPEKLFDHGLERALALRGFNVRKKGYWDFSTQNLKTFNKNIISLKIEKFDMLSYSTGINVTSEFNIKLTGYLGVPRENKVYSAGITLQNKPVGFTISDEKIKEEFDKILTEAVNRVVSKLLEKI
ncbi:MAG: hypothetical protein HQK84_02130 [Nitrospinae bacterium]|nr:hypothetical protein [Nitrospinota bacterium]